MAEAGLAWVPSMIQGLDIWYQRTRDGRRLTGDSPITLPKLLPSEYFHRQIWISFVDDPIGVKMVGSILDADKVMFGSDYPHPASTWPDSQQIIEGAGRFRPMFGKKSSATMPGAVWNWYCLNTTAPLQETLSRQDAKGAKKSAFLFVRTWRALRRRASDLLSDSDNQGRERDS